MVTIRHLLLLCVLTCASALAWAHKGSDAYLDVRSEPTEGAGLYFTVAIAIKDLDQLAALDADADGKVTWGEIKAATPAVQALLEANTSLASEPAQRGADCALRWGFDGLERRGDGGYMRFASRSACAGERVFRYTLFREQDATHRLIVTGRVNGQDLLSTLSPVAIDGPDLGARGAVTTFGAAGTTANAHAGLAALLVYLRMGVQHLLEGYDHLAFLLALVLPLRLAIRRPRPLVVLPSVAHWDGTCAMASASAGGGAVAFETPRAVAAALPASAATWLTLLRTITAFTIGHSVTLILATLGITQASPAWVEPTIALSIAVTALLNLYPIRHVRTDVLALLFGMVHGFGFAGLLTEAAAPSGLLPWALAGFNIGVECGQLFAVLCWVLLSQLLVGRSWYEPVVVRGGSWVLAALAAFWFWQRVH